EGEELRGRIEIALRNECARQLLFQHVVGRVESRRLDERLQRVVGFATLLERRGHRSELFGGRGALTRALEVAGGNVNREQVFTQLSVCRIDLGRLTNHFDGV